MFNILEILTATKGKLLNTFNENIIIKGITTDTREDCNGKLFIPLKGKNFDGHNFIKIAVEKGAVAALSEIDIFAKIPIVKVKDTLKAFGEIANYWIEKVGMKIIGITGTSGKTTTKELLKYVTQYKGTEQNFNNLIGVPKTILNSKEDFLVIEMGANLTGEIKKLTKIATPEYVIISSIGYGHLEGFGSIENVYKEKLSIINDNPDVKIAVIPDYVIESSLIKKKNIIFKTFGNNEEADIRLLKSSSNLKNGNKIEFIYNSKKYKITSNLLGKYNAYNILSVFLMAKELGFNENNIIAKIEEFQPVNMRNEIINTNMGYTVINDCYNSNFESFKGSIELLNELSVKGKKIMVVGDMYELGDKSEELHEKIGDILDNSNIGIILGYGERIDATLEKINNKKHLVKKFNDKKKLTEFLQKNLKEHDTILLKASRAMKLEEILEGII